MIELGDVIQGKREKSFVGLVTEADLEEVRIVKFDRLYNNRRGSEQFEQGFVRARIRDGSFHKNGHADDLQEAVATRKEWDETDEMTASAEYQNSTAYKFDSVGTESVYEDVNAGENPEELDGDRVFFDTHNSEWRTIEAAGWCSDGLADDLLRMGDGSVESLSTVAQAMREGLWLLMTPENQKIQGNRNLDVDLEVDNETGKILK